MDIHHPKEWLASFLANVPEENRESFGQMQALREYGDAISSLPERDQKKLWAAFNEALDETFPSRRTEIPSGQDPVIAKPTGPSDEQIIERALPVFSAPGDQSPEFREMLFHRAMGIVDQELDGNRFFSRRRRRKVIAKRIREWMAENLPSEEG